MSAEVRMMFVLSLRKMLYVVPMHINTTFSSLSYRSVCCSKYLQKYQLFVVSIPLKSMIGFEYSQKSTGLMSDDSVSQLTGLASPVHCPPKVWFKCSLIVNRKWGGPIMHEPHTLSLKGRYAFEALNKPTVHCTC